MSFGAYGTWPEKSDTPPRPELVASLGSSPSEGIGSSPSEGIGVTAPPRPEQPTTADLVAQARETSRALSRLGAIGPEAKRADLLTALATALEDTVAERDRLKDALHEIRLGCINPQQLAHNALFREENP